MTAATQPIIQLRYSDDSQRVVIEKDGANDRFVITVAAAIDACHASGQKEEFYRQFRDMQVRLTEWLKVHADLIDEAYLTVRDAAILFLAVQKSPAFNQALEDSLTDLDIAIAQEKDLSLIRLNVLAIPKTSAASVESLLVCGSANL